MATGIQPRNRDNWDPITLGERISKCFLPVSPASRAQGQPFVLEAVPVLETEGMAQPNGRALIPIRVSDRGHAGHGIAYLRGGLTLMYVV